MWGRNIVFLEPKSLQYRGFKLEHLVDVKELVGLKWNAKTVAVVDGNSVNLTKMGQAVIPRPMYASRLLLMGLHLSWVPRIYRIIYKEMLVVIVVVSMLLVASIYWHILAMEQLHYVIALKQYLMGMSRMAPS